MERYKRLFTEGGGDIIKVLYSDDSLLQGKGTKVRYSKGKKKVLSLGDYVVSEIEKNGEYLENRKGFFSLGCKDSPLSLKVDKNDLLDLIDSIEDHVTIDGITRKKLGSTWKTYNDLFMYVSTLLPFTVSVVFPHKENLQLKSQDIINETSILAPFDTEEQGVSFDIKWGGGSSLSLMPDVGSQKVKWYITNLRGI